MLKRIVTIALLITSILSISIPANSITFGREVTNGSDSYPSVISIWYAETAEDRASFICTGTLIEPKIVLTAAHCVLSTGLYFVQYGADQLYDDLNLLPVSATWRNPRYSASQMVNDTGLLLLESEIPGAQTTRLPSSAEIKKILGTKGVKFEIVGWGKDQNDEPATYLRKASVDDQTSFMKKYKGWRNDVWLAVGKWNSKEKVFAGSCNGDSGGPLFATVGSKKIIAGITSWGAEDCETRAPSVYVRLSYYIDSLVNSGIPTLLTNEVKQNRSLPSVITEPTISGSTVPDSTITCNQGTWSENTKNVSISWSGPGISSGTSSPTVRVSKVTTESKYICEVTGTNANGSTVRKVSIVQAAPPQVIKSPVIQGVPAGTEYTGNNSVSCVPATFSGATSTQNYWWIGLSYSSPTDNVGTGNSLILTKELIAKYGGGYLYCQTVASGPGGNTQSSSSTYIAAWSKPTVKSGWPQITSQSSQTGSFAGNLLTCSPVVWDKPVDSEAYSIYIRTGTSTNRVLSNSATYVMTSDVINNFQNYEIHCSITGTNAGGSYTATSSSGFTIRPGIKPNAPVNFGGNIGPSSVTLTWSAPANNGVAITDYVIERSSATSDWTVINDGISTSVTFTDMGLTPGARYDYRARAFNGTTYSDYSATISANIPLATTTTTATSSSSTPSPTQSSSPTTTSTSLTCVLLKNGRVDSTTKQPCTELINAGINVSNLALTQTINSSGPTFSTNQLFAQVPGDNYFVSWWLSDRSYNKSNWTYPPSGSVFKNLQESNVGPNFTPSQSVLDSLKGQYLTVWVTYGYARFNILEANGVGVLPAIGIGSLLIP